MTAPRWERVPGAVSRRVSDGVAVLGPEAADVLVLRGLAAHVWTLLATPSDAESLIASLAAASPAPVGAEDSLLGVLVDLESRGVLRAC